MLPITRRFLSPCCTTVGKRVFHSTGATRINPLMPIDGILEELDNDETKKKLKKLKRKQDPNKPKILIPMNEDTFKSSEHESQSVGEKQYSSADNKGNSSASGGNGNNGNSNNNNNNNNGYTEHDYEEQEETAWDKFKGFLFKALETSGITFASLAVLGGAGVAYHKFYNFHVISKMRNAFDKGDDAFELTMHKRTTSREGDWIERPEQKLLDDIISGNIVGRYFLVTGEKGCGKSSMILDSMKKVDSFNCAFIDAHSDPEIFRIRLGKALNFEFHEDYIGSLFSIRGPRDTTALLDIERAFNKLEEVAIGKVKKHGKPLTLIINNSHLIKADEEGVKLVELLQQKAEALSGAGLVTMIFNSDDYWLYERLKQLGTRLEVINVRDFNREQSVHALSVTRKRFFNENLDPKVADEVYELIGGRPQHLAEVTKQPDILKACHKLIDREKTWFLNQCGLLGSGMDDDVNESGKFATSSMLLAKTLVEMYKQNQNDSKHVHHWSHKLPELPLWRARQIMTRNDFIQLYDNLNIFTIDSSNSFVRADSVPMMRGFLEIVQQPGFEELLKDTLDRVAEIESLGRTREIVAKDLVLGSKYNIKNKGDEIVIGIDQQDEEEDEDHIKIHPTTIHGAKQMWKERLNYTKPSE